jgi:internalin A
MYEHCIAFTARSLSMNRIGLLAFSLCIVVCPLWAGAPTGLVKDKNLEAALRATLHEPKAELKDDLLAKVYVLEAAGKGIKNLAGLEKCKNVQLIRLDKNQIVDLTPLKGLANLQSLDLTDNLIEEIAPLAGLTRLQYLQLGNNQIDSVEPLAGLTNLNTLSIANNEVRDLKALAGLNKLWSLYLGKNRIRDITPLAKLTRIATLELKDNKITDISPLAGYTDLSLLMIDKNRIKDLTPLVKAAEADAKGSKRFAPYLRLYLAENPFEDRMHVEALKAIGVRVFE